MPCLKRGHRLSVRVFKKRAVELFLPATGTLKGHFAVALLPNFFSIEAT